MTVKKVNKQFELVNNVEQWIKNYAAKPGPLDKTKDAPAIIGYAIELRDALKKLHKWHAIDDQKLDDVCKFYSALFSDLMYSMIESHATRNLQKLSVWKEKISDDFYHGFIVDKDYEFDALDLVWMWAIEQCLSESDWVDNYYREDDDTADDTDDGES
jgi:hypothetical protein